MQEIIVATSNPGKVKEIRAYFADLSLQLHSLSNYVAAADMPEETGTTFVENAIIKARYVAEQTGKPALADDSGIVVAALNGEPGVYSARYAGIDRPNSEHLAKLQSELAKCGEVRRDAYFYCALVLMRFASDPAPLIATGLWQGEIARKLKGEHGFGYDPLFYVPAQNCTAAELSLEQKNQFSHRAQALNSMKQQLIGELV